ncbi:MAG: hypothetical protein J7K04_01340 [Spirochaetales bacterium]|nr:hypothetical protein [Spirochaetales bacterium]
MVKKIPLLFILTVLSGSLFPEDANLEEAVKSLLDSALRINIEARILPNDEKPVWNTKSTELTIPGRSVAVKLIGENLRIYAIFTPYKMRNGNILLVAQGQVWLTEMPDKEVKYLSTFKSIPITFGEKVVFFPLGVSSKLKSKKYFNVELEIQIVPYKEKAKADVSIPVPEKASNVAPAIIKEKDIP